MAEATFPQCSNSCGTNANNRFGCSLYGDPCLNAALEMNYFAKDLRTRREIFQREMNALSDAVRKLTSDVSQRTDSDTNEVQLNDSINCSSRGQSDDDTNTNFSEQFQFEITPEIPLKSCLSQSSLPPPAPPPTPNSIPQIIVSPPNTQNHNFGQVPHRISTPKGKDPNIIPPMIPRDAFPVSTISSVSPNNRISKPGESNSCRSDSKTKTPTESKGYHCHISNCPLCNGQLKVCIFPMESCFGSSESHGDQRTDERSSPTAFNGSSDNSNSTVFKQHYLEKETANTDSVNVQECTGNGTCTGTNSRFMSGSSGRNTGMTIGHFGPSSGETISRTTGKTICGTTNNGEISKNSYSLSDSCRITPNSTTKSIFNFKMSGATGTNNGTVTNYSKASGISVPHIHSPECPERQLFQAKLRLSPRENEDGGIIHRTNSSYFGPRVDPNDVSSSEAYGKRYKGYSTASESEHTQNSYSYSTTPTNFSGPE